MEAKQISKAVIKRLPGIIAILASYWKTMLNVYLPMTLVRKCVSQHRRSARI